MVAFRANPAAVINTFLPRPITGASQVRRETFGKAQPSRLLQAPRCDSPALVSICPSECRGVTTTSRTRPRVATAPSEAVRTMRSFLRQMGQSVEWSPSKPHPLMNGSGESPKWRQSSSLSRTPCPVSVALGCKLRHHLPFGYLSRQEASSREPDWTSGLAQPTGQIPVGLKEVGLGAEDQGGAPLKSGPNGNQPSRSPPRPQQRGGPGRRGAGRIIYPPLAPSTSPRPCWPTPRNYSTHKTGPTRAPPSDQALHLWSHPCDTTRPWPRGSHTRLFPWWLAEAGPVSPPPSPLAWFARPGRSWLLAEVR